MGHQDNATSAESVVNIIWVQEDGRLTITSLEKLNASAQQRLARQGVFGRIQGTNGDKNYILVGKMDPERGFVVVNYETIKAVPWVFDGTHLVHPSRRKYAATCAADGCWEVQDYDLGRRVPDAGPWTSVPGRFLQNRRIAGRSEPNTVIVANRYSILQDERAEPVHELPAQPHQPREEPAGAVKKAQGLKKARGRRGRRTLKALEKDLGDQFDGGSCACACADSECGHRVDASDRDKFEATVRQARVQRERVKARRRERIQTLHGEETAYVRNVLGEVQYDADGDVVFDDGLMEVRDGRLHVGDGTLLRSRLAWKDLDLEESKARSVRGDHPDERDVTPTVSETPTVRARLVQGLTVEAVAAKESTMVAVVDGGSHITLLTKKEARALGILHLVGRRRVLIRGIGKAAVYAFGGNSVEFLMRCHCSECHGKLLPRMHDAVYIWEDEDAEESLVAPHGFRDLWQVQGKGESFFFDADGHRFHLNYRDRTVYMTLRSTGKVEDPDVPPSEARARCVTSGKPLQWSQPADPDSALATKSKESMPKAAAEAALRKLTADFVAQEQDRRAADTRLAEQESELRKVNAELDALRLDFARQAEYCEDQAKMLNGRLTFRMVHDKSAPCQFRMEEIGVNGAMVESAVTAESVIRFIDESDVELAQAVVGPAGGSAEDAYGGIHVTWRSEDARRRFEKPIQALYNHRQREQVMLNYHYTHNHLRLDLMNADVRAGKVPNGIVMHRLACPVCHPPTPGMAAGGGSNVARSVVRKPWHTFHADLFILSGAKQKNRHGMTAVLGVICQSTGMAFVIGLRRKSDALDGMKTFLRFYRMHQPDVEAKWGSIGFRVLRSDRGGEFVAALAEQESAFEAWLREEKIELDLSDAEDHRMNAKAEEMWRWMVPGAEKLLRVSGLTDQFFVDALTCYVITYNQQRTAANRLGGGAPPWESLGLRCFHPERLRTFGSLGWLKRPVGKAGKDPDDRGRAGGLPHRRHMVVHLGYTWTMRGYAVLDIARRMLYVSRKVSVDPITTGTMSFLRQIRENPAMARLQTTPTGMKWVRKVFKDVSQPSVDADPLPLGDGDALWSDRLGDLITDDPVDGDERLWDRHLDGVVPGIATVSGGSSSRTPGGGGDGDPGNDIADGAIGRSDIAENSRSPVPSPIIRDGAPIAVMDPVVRRDHRGSRRAPKSKRTGVALTWTMMKELKLRPCFKTTRTMSTGAWVNPKSGLSALRLDLYHRSQSVSDLEYWRKEVRNFGNGKEGTVWKVGDCSFDFEHGIMDVIDTRGQRFTRESWTENSANLIRHGRTGEAGPVGDGNVVRQLDLSTDDGGTGGVVRSYRVISGDKISYETQRLRNRRRGRPEWVTEKRERVIATSAAELSYGTGKLDTELFERVKKWVSSSSLPSDKASSGLSQVPAWVAMGMRARTMVQVEGMEKPVYLQDALRSEHWPLWAEAIKREAAGLILAGLWDEVPESSVPKGKRVNQGHWVFDIKTELGKFVKAKARYVFDGNRSVGGVDYTETAANMAHMKSVRTLCALTAARDWEMRQYDISQAFTIAECEADVWIQLPQLPLGGMPENYYDGCGRGRGSGYVGKLRRMLYGMCDAGRCWDRELAGFFTKIGARRLHMDKSVWVWHWGGHMMYLASHVDDVLVSYSSDLIKDKFDTEIRAHFGQNANGEERVTGGVDEVREYLGIAVERDRQKKTITLHQYSFTKQLLASFHGERLKQGRSAPLDDSLPMEKWKGEAINHFDYMRLVGSLQWLVSSTRPDLAFACQLLSRYTSNPGPVQWDQATHVLEYLNSHTGLGVTYHGDPATMNDPYDQTDKLMVYVDSDHRGCADSFRSTTGMVIMLNGGPVMWKSRIQGSNSTSTAESEVRALSYATAQVKWFKVFMDELEVPQETIRVMEDNYACKQIVHKETDSAKIVGFLPVKAYIEDAIRHGILWVDKISGKLNPADILTKPCTGGQELDAKTKHAHGVVPRGFESPEVLDVLRGNR